MMNKPRGRGRPSAPTGARDAILDVARRRFLADGYNRVTLRSVASEAGVDVALISYHFGSKRGLFGACVALKTNPADVLAAVLGGRDADLPERLLAALLAIWDDAERRAPLEAMIEAVASGTDVGRVFREVVERELMGRIVEHVSGSNATGRAAAATAQLAGLIFLRYIVKAEPLASMPRAHVIASFTPPLRAALAPVRIARPAFR